LAHRRRCQPGSGGGGSGGGGCDSGRQLCRVVGQRCSGADVGSREKAIAWARVERTHRDNDERQRGGGSWWIAVNHDTWCIRWHPRCRYATAGQRGERGGRPHSRLAPLRRRRSWTPREVIGPTTVARTRAN